MGDREEEKGFLTPRNGQEDDYDYCISPLPVPKFVPFFVEIGSLFSETRSEEIEEKEEEEEKQEEVDETRDEKKEEEEEKGEEESDDEGYEEDEEEEEDIYTTPKSKDDSLAFPDRPRKRPVPFCECSDNCHFLSRTKLKFES